ncbi:hypothetical protein [Halorientalis sp.]|uniref:hypothetical protein n=1 Tax=Halorientalis sp. TaxID=1931229 RepID=UPI002616D1EC|nr:hypothetical protein [Halorientalis sp.]
MVRFSIPDSADHLLETSLLELLSLYDRLESGTTGTIVVHMGAHLRVTADQPETVLDLTRWTWSESEGEWVVSTPGPAVAGEREAVLEVLADPIREAIGTVEDHGWGVEAVRQRHDSDRTELMTRLSVWERLVE